MPVDTYLRGKNLSKYQKFEFEGLEVHVALTLAQWAQSVIVDATRFLFWKRFDVAVDHRHQPT